jgi:hypothetical protein
MAVVLPLAIAAWRAGGRAVYACSERLEKKNATTAKAAMTNRGSLIA